MEPKLPVQKYLSANLFEEIGLLNLAPEERAQFLDKFGEVLQYKLTYRIMRELSPDQKDRLEAILAQEPLDTSAVSNFFASEMPNFETIAAEEVADYKRELIERFKAK